METYTLTIYIINSPIVTGMLACIMGIIIYKIAYKLVELIPGM